MEQKHNQWHCPLITLSLLALLILSALFKTCSTLTSDAQTGAEANVGVRSPRLCLTRFFCIWKLKARKPDRPLLINCRYTVSRPVRGSCAQWGPPMTRWPTWFPWTWSSTQLWPRPGILGHRCPAGGSGGQTLDDCGAVLAECFGMSSEIFLPTYRPQNIPVYNCTTGGINPFRWGEVGRLSILIFCFDTTDLWQSCFFQYLTMYPDL